MVDFFYPVTTLFILLASLKERIKATPNEVYFFCGIARYNIRKNNHCTEAPLFRQNLNNLINFVNLEQEYTRKQLSKSAKKRITIRNNRQ